MNKIIFVLTYAEGDLFIRNYRKEFYPDDARIIILDNGRQDRVREWAESNNIIYFRSENNLGTTGGYNWFIRVGSLLGASRAVVMQADVELLRPETMQLLLADHWQQHDFVYFPNMARHCWAANGEDSDIGQLFSINPKFWLNAGWLCDENFTVTHFESIDLFVRITSKRNVLPAKLNNLLYLYSKDSNEDQSFYKIYSVSSGLGEHNPWFVRNFNYWKQKWGYHLPDMTIEQGWDLFRNNQLDWANNPWIQTENFHAAINLHRWALDPHRNISAGQVPYPVEHEVNRFYQLISSVNLLP